MDIAYYLSELLEQLGEVNVPGLGSFTRVKVDGYYNNAEGRFYPPSSKIEFSQQNVDDEVLTRYIGLKKRISLASSKYFTEKYLDGLRQEIMVREVTLADVGTLRFENGEVRFKPAEALPDPAFFGYPKITLNKLGNEPAYNWDESITTEPVPEPNPEPAIEHEPIEESPVNEDEPVLQNELVTNEEAVQEESLITHEPVPDETLAEYHGDFTPQPADHAPQAEDEDNFIFHATNYEAGDEEEESRRSYKWLWITLLTLVVAGGAVFAYFYFQPTETRAVKKVKPVPALTPIKQDSTDSPSAIPTVKDTAVGGNTAKLIQNRPASTIDSTKRRYEVIGASTRTLAEANKVINNFKSIGIDAHIVKGAPGRRLKISLGTYATNAEATAAINTLLKTRKVKGIWPLPINPKK